MQRVGMEFVSAPENFIEQECVPIEVTDQQSFGELAFVLEVVKETALGNADLGDDFLDRSR
jgi:hypothetical protein